MKQSYDILQDVVHLEFADGKRLAASGHDVRRYGLAEIIRRAGVDEPPERVPVKQGGRVIGSVSSYFTPMCSRSESWLYQPRQHDFVHRGDHWEAHNTLGPGDLDAVPEFRWGDVDVEGGRLKRLEDDRDLLRKAVFGDHRGDAASFPGGRRKTGTSENG